MFRRMKFLAGLATSALLALSAAPAYGALTFGATTVTKDGAYTLDGVAASVYSIGATTTTGTITIGGSAQTGTTLIRSSNITGTTTTSGVVISDAALTTGTGLYVLGSGATMEAGGAVQNIAMGAATVGNGLTLSTTGAYTGTGVVRVVADGLTTGVGLIIPHATSVIADGGSLLRLSSSSVDTGGATNGTILDVKSTGQLAGTVARFDNILTTGTGISVIGTGIMTTTGNLLTLTGNAATTAAGLLRLNANGLTSGIGAVLTSSATAITGAGRLLYVNHTGATGDTAILNEFTSAATDETVVLRVSSAAMVDGVNLSVVGTTGMTTGSLIRATTSTAGLVATNGIVSIRGTGAHTSTANAGLLDVQSSGLVGTAANGTLVNFQTTAADQVDTTVLNVENSGFTTGYTGSMLRVKSPTTTCAARVVDVIADGITSGGTAMKISTAALTTGDGLLITNGTSAVTTGSLLNVTASGTGAIATDGIVSISHAGIYTSTSAVDGGLLDVRAPATTAGVLVNVVAAGLITGQAVSISNGTAATTSGSLLRVAAGGTGAVATNGIVSLIHSGIYTSTSNAGFVNITANATTAGTVLAVNATGLVDGIGIYSPSAEAGLTTGKYLSLGGVFTVAKFGATVITGTAEGTAALTLTNGDIVVTQGNVLISDGALATAIETVASAAAFPIDSGIVRPTGTDTITTITGGVAGQTLTLLFTTAIAFTDDATKAANTININGAFTSSDLDTLVLIFDGTSWYELSRTVL